MGSCLRRQSEPEPDQWWYCEICDRVFNRNDPDTPYIHYMYTVLCGGEWQVIRTRTDLLLAHFAYRNK